MSEQPIEIPNVFDGLFSLHTAIPDEITNKMATTLAVFSNEPVFVVENQVHYDFAADILKQMKGEVKLVVAAREVITKPLTAEKARVIGLFQPFQDTCKKHEDRLKLSMQGYLNEVERLRVLAEAEAEEKARKERERLESRAEIAEGHGKTEKADALINMSMVTHAKPVAAAVAAPIQPKGVSTKVKWSAEITDKRAFVEAAVNDRSMMACIDIDIAKVNKMAVMLKEEFDMPGAKAKKDSSLAIRSQ